MLLHYALSRPVAVNALRVALVVGTCLNAINHGPQVLEGEPIVWSKVALNFLVPYLVATYSGAKALAAQPCAEPPEAG
jgi:hypothetical protein